MALNGKTAILSGAGAGIGAATARRFSQEGANLALIDLDEEALTNTERDCRKGEGGLLTVCDDASNPDAIDGLIAETIARFGQIDILVNNAVYRVHKPFLEITHEEFQRSLEVNVTSYYFFAQKVVPHMIEAGGGSIINLSSTFGFVGSPGTVALLHLERGGGEHDPDARPRIGGKQHPRQCRRTRPHRDGRHARSH